MLEVRLRPDPGVGLRSGVATVEVVGGVSLAHAAAAASTGEPGPGLVSVLAVAALVLPATMLVLRHKITLRLALTLLVLAQVTAHVVLTAGQTHAAGHAAHLPWQMSWQMATAHLVGALLTALVWHARRQLLEAAVGWPRAVDVVVAAPKPLVEGVRHVTATAWTRAHPLRGPPAVQTCA